MTWGRQWNFLFPWHFERNCMIIDTSTTESALCGSVIYDSHCDCRFNKLLGDETLEISMSKGNESADNIYVASSYYFSLPLSALRILSNLIYRTHCWIYELYIYVHNVQIEKDFIIINHHYNHKYLYFINKYDYIIISFMRKKIYIKSKRYI